MVRLNMNTHKRSGFTLVEMLIVVGIVVLLAVILVPVSLKVMSQNKVANGIGVFQGYLAQARTRAIATQKAQGLRLHAMQEQDRRVQPAGTMLAWYDRIEFIEMPGDYCEGFVWSYLPPGPRQIALPVWRLAAGGIPETFAGLDAPYQVLQPYTIGAPGPAIPLVANRLYGPFGTVPGFAGLKQVNPFSFSPAQNLQPFVEVGDVVELTGVGQIYYVTGVQFNVGVVPSFLTIDRNLTHDVPMPMNGLPNYRVHRQPRPIPGTSAVKLPGEVLIDLNPTAAGGAPNMAAVTAGGDRDVNNLVWMRGLSRGVNISFPGYPSPPGTTPVAPRYIDLVFDASGQLIPMNRQFPNLANPTLYEQFTITSDGMVYLWLHPAGSPNSWASGSPNASSGEADSQSLIVINSRNGAVSCYQVDHTTVAADPWADVKRARADGVGGF